MGKHISTYWADPPGKGHCEIHLETKGEYFYIKYFDQAGKQFFVEDFVNKSHRYVEDAAENWCMGIKKLEAAVSND